MRSLNARDIDTSVSKDVPKEMYPAEYAPQTPIKDVKVLSLPTYPSEEGDFGEIFRIDKAQLESIPGFTLAQINRTTLIPGSIKAWHLHFEQDEIWYVCPSDHLFIGLWDVRRGSPTHGKTMRIVIGAGTSQVVYIPHGVAHGSAVMINKSIELYVFVNKQFNPAKHDEKRVPWDTLGADFWQPKRD